MDGLERRGVNWRQRKTMTGENWKEFGGFERNTGGLEEITAVRRGLEDIHV